MRRGARGRFFLFQWASALREALDALRPRAKDAPVVYKLRRFGWLNLKEASVMPWMGCADQPPKSKFIRSSSLVDSRDFKVLGWPE